MLKGISSWRIIAKTFSLKFARLLDSERPALRSVWRLIFFWLERMMIWYLSSVAVSKGIRFFFERYAHPSAFNCFSFSGTLLFHHFQSEASLANRFPEAVAINVESCAISMQHENHAEAVFKTHTRSNAATFRLFTDFDCVCAFSPAGPEVYLPAMRLLLTTLHVIFSGFFCEMGVKKEATAVSSIRQKIVRSLASEMLPLILTGRCRLDFASDRRRRHSA